MTIKSGVGVEEVHAQKRSAGVYDAKGRFIPDGRPMEPPVGYRRAPSLSEQIRQMVQSEQLAAAARESGVETFEEANDFFIEDEPDSHYLSGYENDEDTPLERLLAAKAADDAAAVSAASSEASGASSSGGAGEAVPPSPKAAKAAPAGPEGPA